MIEETNQLKFKRKNITVPGWPGFECYVLLQTPRKRMILKPTDESWEYFHLILIRTPTKGPATFHTICDSITSLELSIWQKFE
jgi:hypothetical protein